MAYLEIRKNGKLIKRLKATERDENGDYAFRLDDGRMVFIPPDETITKGDLAFRITGGKAPGKQAGPPKGQKGEISYQCLKCKARLVVAAELSGQKEECPRCGFTQRVPEKKSRRVLIAAVVFAGVLVVGGVLMAVMVMGKNEPHSRKDEEHEVSLAPDLGDGVTLEFVKIPAGSFMMGSPKDEEGRYGGEGPRHTVTISKPFYLGICEVTQEQYAAVMGRNPSRFKGAERPVEGVSWNDAVGFCEVLSKKTGHEVRLPTEAEWEYACRAGTTTRFSFGDDSDDLGVYAWYCSNSDEETHPVGQKKPNPWGLHDMHGNVWEWCEDWYENYADEEAKDPAGPSSGKYRVRRGGSWYNLPRHCRSARRSGDDPGRRFHFHGFRVVVPLSAGVD